MRLTFLLIFSCCAWAQQRAPVPSFAVASIRPSDPDLRTELIGTDPGIFQMRNVTLRRCIEWAYDVKPYQLQGAGWLNDLRFDISAKAPDLADDDRLHLMLQTLLADRFGLRIRRESKELPTYALIVAKGGLKLHEAGPGNTSKMVESKSDASPKFTETEDKTGAVGERVTMADVAVKIAQLLDRPVIDKTNVRGRYDFRVDMRPYLSGDGGGKADIISVLFTGFQEQLGLRFDAEKDVIDLLIVTEVNRVPAEN